MADQLEALELPQLVTPEWIAHAQASLLKSTWKGTGALKQVLPKNVVISILGRTERLVTKEDALVEVRERLWKGAQGVLQFLLYTSEGPTS